MKRTLKVLLASLGLVTVASIYIKFQGAPVAQSRPAAGPVSINAIEPAQGATPGQKMISFVHFNDFHAHYQPKDYNGRVLSPLSLLRGYRDQVKAENPNTLFCSAGDDMEKGSIVDFLSRGAATIEIYKELGLDLRAVGNHDFAYGLDTLKRFVTQTSGVVLCANHSVAKDYHAFEIDGVRIGVFSMVGQPWNERNEQYDGPFFEGVGYRYDFSALAREIIRKHRSEVDLLFLLSHLGLTTEQQVAAEAPGLDFIIGGHSHTLLWQAERSPQGTVIVQAGSFGEHVGRLDIMVDAQSRKMAAYHYRITPVHPQNMAPNLELEKKIREICRRYDSGPEAPIATLPKALSKDALAKLAGEAAIAVLKADAAVIDPGTVWGSLPAGPTTRQDLLDAFRVEIQPPGTHGFSALLTANVRANDWEAIKSKSGGPFIFVGKTSGRGQDMLRIALQRNTAVQIRDLFKPAPELDSLRFEMEVWEALARHLSASPAATPKPTAPAPSPP
jgi:5'-nucleotidase/UDP-sugar diphosphatase